MISLNYLVRKKSNVSLASFADYWLGDHARKCLQIAQRLGIGKYTKCETQHEDDVNKTLQHLYGTQSDSYDFVDQMVIGDLANFKNGLADAEVQAMLKVIREHESAYVDYSRSNCWFSIDVPQIFPRDEITATWNNTFLKVIYTGYHLPNLTLAEAQLHWNSCHGGLARQFAQFLPYTKYVQGHRIESKVLDQIKEILNVEFASNQDMMGQAEAWIDRRIMPALMGPETERMMRMLVQDIAMFTDTTKGHIFATKEHVILSRDVITEPIPTLFTAD